MTGERQQRGGSLETRHPVGPHDPLDVWTGWARASRREVGAAAVGRGRTYADDDGRHESPAHFEEERRREAQHHLHVLEVVPVTCQVTNTHQVLNIGHVQAGQMTILLLIVILNTESFTKVHTSTWQRAHKGC